MDRRNSPSCDALWTATLLQGDDVSNVGILDDSTNTNFGSLGVSSPLLADDSRLAFLDDKENIQRSSSLQDGQSRSYSQLSGRKRSRGTASDKTMDWSSSRFVAPEKSNLEHSFADMSGVPKAAMGAAPEAALVPKVKSESDEQVGASAEQRDARTIYAPGTVIPGVPLRPEEEEIEREAFWKYGTLPEVDLRGAPTAAAVADAALLAPTSEDCAVPPAAAATAALLPESKSEHDYQEDMVERLEGYITVRIENGRSFDGTVDGTEKMPDGSSSKELLEWLRQYADDTIPKTPAMLRAQPLIEELLHSHSRSFDELASDVDSSKTYQDFVAEFKNIFRREKGYGFSGSESHPLFEKSNRADHRAEDLLEMLSSLVIQQFSDEDRSVIIALLVSTWQDLLTANYRMTPDELEAKQDAFRRDVANQISYHYHVLQIPLERTFIRFANGRGGNKYRAIYVHLQDATSKRYVKMLAPLIGLANAKAFVKKLNETWEGEVMLMVYVGRTKDGQPTVHYNVCASRNKTREGREREGIRVVGFSSKAMVPVRTTLHNYADIQLMENSMQLFVTQGPLRVCLAYVQEKNTPTDLVPAMPPRTMATEPNGDDEDVTIREQAREIVRLKAALQRSENENARLQAALSPSPTTQQQQQQQQQQPAELMATIAEKDRVIAGLENKLAKLRAIWNECTGRLLSGQQLLSAPLQQSSQPHPAAIASIPAEGNRPPIGTGPSRINVTSNHNDNDRNDLSTNDVTTLSGSNVEAAQPNNLSKSLIPSTAAQSALKSTDGVADATAAAVDDPRDDAAAAESSGRTLFHYMNDTTNITPAMRLAQLPMLLRTFAALGLNRFDKGIALCEVRPENLIFPSRAMYIATLKVIELQRNASSGAGSELYLYCAPEVLTARCTGRAYEYDAQADMYSFGCTAIEFVLKRDAYKKLLTDHKTILFPPSVKKELKACNVPEGLIELILSMVHKNTKDRLSDFQLLLYHPVLLNAPNPLEVVPAYMKDCDCQRMNAQAGLVHERTQKELALREVSVLRERLDKVQQLTTTLQAGAPSAAGAALPPANVGDPERRTAMRRMINGTLVELEASGADYDKNSISLEVFEAFSNAGPTITVGDIRHFLTGDDPKYPDRAIPPQLLTEDRINLMGKTEANKNVKKARMGKGPTDKTRAQGFLRGFHKQYWSNVEE